MTTKIYSKKTKISKNKTKKKAKAAPLYEDFKVFLYEQLQDSEFTLLYLKECLDDEDPRIFLRALENVCAARGIKAKFTMPKPKKAKLSSAPRATNQAIIRPSPHAASSKK